MASFQQQEYPLVEAAYNPAVSANVSSYFVRPNKVVKSGSRNSSPRSNLARRKTVTAVPTSSRNRTAVEHLRSSTQWQNSRSRPVSWHPGSFEALNHNIQPTTNVQDFSSFNYSTCEVNGLVTPISYPTMNEPQIQEIFTPLDEPSGQQFNLAYGSQLSQDCLWTNQAQGKMDLYSLPLYSQLPFTHPAWHLNQSIGAPNVQTAPPSPQCLPIPNIKLDTLSLGNVVSVVKDDSEELVGMGLYDSPAEVQSSSLLFGGFPGSGRKGLKLEESFEPGEHEDGEEEESEDDAQDYDSADYEPLDRYWNSYGTDEYESQSIADHLTYGLHSQPDPLASKYLATLRQMNSSYYPPGHPGYGWV